MAQDEKLRQIGLPDALCRQFALLQKRLFRIESLSALSVGLSAAFVSFVFLFGSDRFWDSPIWLRVFCTGSAAIVIMVSALWWAKRWVFCRRDMRALAKLVQRRFPRLGDRLLGIVELADEERRPAYFSPELYRAAIDQVAAESARYEFENAVATRQARLGGWVALGAGLVALVPFLLLPEAGINALQRWAMPAAAIPRFTLVQLHGFPSEHVVAHGEEFEIHGQVRYRSFWQPSKAWAQFLGERRIAGTANATEVRIPVPGQVENRALTISLGDARHQIQIRPSHRPALTQLEAAIQLPEYLGYEPLKQNIISGGLSAVEGSKVALKGKTSRELRMARIHLADERIEDLEISETTFKTRAFDLPEVERARFTWMDALGLTNAQPWILGIQVEKDAPPVPEFADLMRETAVLETEVIPIKLRGRDDFGVKTLGLIWESDTALEGTNGTTATEFKYDTTNRQTLVFEQTYHFAPSVLRLPPDTTVELRAFAVDFLPDRERILSPAYRIHILGNAKHAEMIRQNLESLLVHLEEVTRLEERISSETRELKETAKLDSAESTQKLQELKETQEQNAKALSDMAEEGMKTLREALRNPAFNEELLSKWAKDLHQMQKLAEQEMKQASQSLESAASKSDAQQRGERMAEAEQTLDQILQQLQDMQKEVNEGLDELQALTLSQRLRKLSGETRKTEGSLQKTISDTIGLHPYELSGRFQKANAFLANEQAGTQSESSKLQGEISRFYERTQKPNYGQVSKEMVDAKTSEELERVAGLIKENVGMEAIQTLSLWADRFSAWADLLEPKSPPSSSGGNSGGQGGEQGPDSALQQLLALLRIRERQVNIQDRTRLLHQYVEEKTSWRDGAVLLAASQSKLNGDLTKEAVENPFALLEAPYDEALTQMSDVESLLDKPRTDEVTTKQQDESVKTLSDLINLLNEQAKNNSSSSSSQSQAQMEQMAFLMEMMRPQNQPGMMPSQNPGGNFSGGTTDRAGDPIQGEVTGKEGEDRSSVKASGLPQNYPAEFREALEQYFKALEAEQK